MTGKKSEQGYSGETAAQNVQRLREDQRLTYAELSRLLDDLGRSIPPLGLRRIESGERRIDVDDLVSLAAALGVSPSTLLMPTADEPTEPVALTARGDLTADTAWQWITAGNIPVVVDRSDVEWMLRSVPWWVAQLRAAQNEVASRWQWEVKPDGDD